MIPYYLLAPYPLNQFSLYYTVFQLAKLVARGVIHLDLHYLKMQIKVSLCANPGDAIEISLWSILSFNRWYR